MCIWIVKGMNKSMSEVEREKKKFFLSLGPDNGLRQKNVTRQEYHEGMWGKKRRKGTPILFFFQFFNQQIQFGELSCKEKT